jgi:hypothetical protein
MAIMAICVWSVLGKAVCLWHSQHASALIAMVQAWKNRGSMMIAVKSAVVLVGHTYSRQEPATAKITNIFLWFWRKNEKLRFEMTLKIQFFVFNSVSPTFHTT